MPFDPNKPFTTLDDQQQPQATGFDPNKPFKTLDTPDVSETESLVRGAAQGASGGFIDEATGAIMAAGKTAFGDDKLADLPQTYRRERDASREAYKTAAEVNPTSYNVGQIGGGAATMLVPGLNVAKGAGLAKTALVGAAEGGLFGLGSSEADLTKGEVGQAALDTASGAALGAGLGVGIKKVSDASERVLGALKGMSVGDGVKEAVVKKGAKLVGDLPENVTERLMKDPTLLDNPKSLDAIGDELVDSVNNLRGALSEYSNQAWKTLSDQADIPPDSLVSPVRQVLMDNKIIVPNKTGELVPSGYGQDRAALRKANEVLRDLGRYETVSERDLKSIIQKIDKEIDWDKAELDTSNRVMEGIREALDSALKTKNQAYQEAMKPVADRARMLNQLRREFRLRRDGEGFVGTDQTLSKLKTLSDDTTRTQTMKPETRETVSRFSELGGPNLMRELESNRLQRMADQDITRGSKGTLQGIAMGSVGGVPGMIAGMVSGAVKDAYGRKAAVGAIKKLASTPGEQLQRKASRLPPKYRSLLEDAGRRGGNSLAVTHFMLNQTDPEYQSLMAEDED